MVEEKERFSRCGVPGGVGHQLLLLPPRLPPPLPAKLRGRVSVVVVVEEVSRPGLYSLLPATAAALAATNTAASPTAEALDFRYIQVTREARSASVVFYRFLDLVL